MGNEHSVDGKSGGGGGGGGAGTSSGRSGSGRPAHMRRKSVVKASLFHALHTPEHSTSHHHHHHHSQNQLQISPQGISDSNLISRSGTGLGISLPTENRINYPRIPLVFLTGDQEKEIIFFVNEINSNEIIRIRDVVSMELLDPKVSFDRQGMEMVKVALLRDHKDETITNCKGWIELRQTDLLRFYNPFTRRIRVNELLQPTLPPEDTISSIINIEGSPFYSEFDGRNVTNFIVFLPYLTKIQLIDIRIIKSKNTQLKIFIEIINCTNPLYNKQRGWINLEDTDIHQYYDASVGIVNMIKTEEIDEKVEPLIPILPSKKFLINILTINQAIILYGQLNGIHTYQHVGTLFAEDIVELLDCKVYHTYSSQQYQEDLVPHHLHHYWIYVSIIKSVKFPVLNGQHGWIELKYTNADQYYLEEENSGMINLENTETILKQKLPRSPVLPSFAWSVTVTANTFPHLYEYNDGKRLANDYGRIPQGSIIEILDLKIYVVKGVSMIFIKIINVSEYYSQLLHQIGWITLESTDAGKYVSNNGNELRLVPPEKESFEGKESSKGSNRQKPVSQKSMFSSSKKIVPILGNEQSHVFLPEEEEEGDGMKYLLNSLEQNNNQVMTPTVSIEEHRIK